MTDGWQRVLTCTDFYDGPLKGLAEVDGVPHLYDRQFSVPDDEWSNIFALRPLPPALLAPMLEQQAIFFRWAKALQERLVDLSSHPTLPEDRSRYEELGVLIENVLSNVRSEPLLRRGTFKHENGDHLVRWENA